ncbi:MAG TPA: hypothetical protein VG603_08725 [Chitinophagales bacterium]|nr:hypothetical protein [Chitinophagales bacterium]
MKRLGLLLIIVSALFMFSCKRVCYQCTQYCAYCVNRADTSVAVKVCANKSTGNSEVNAMMQALHDSGYVCNLLNDQTNVCDGKNSITSAVDYYKKEDYYCSPTQ